MKKTLFSTSENFSEKHGIVSVEPAVCMAWVFNSNEKELFVNDFLMFINQFHSKRLIVFDDGYYPIFSKPQIKVLQRALGGVGLYELKRFLVNKNDFIAHDGSRVYIDDIIINECIDKSVITNVLDKIYSGLSIDLFVSSDGTYNSISAESILLEKEAIKGIDGCRFLFGDLRNGARFAIAACLNGSDAHFRCEDVCNRNEDFIDYLSESIVHFYPVNFKTKMACLIARKSE
ncbi:hypothetical protein P8F81_14620 [Kosakonia cowanii]|uniref:hypothetical protein n=1 Tax=Kosakonia cowanii TaxID=208223 RepID=UPI002DDCC7DD|nr:hypothetical protein [Kosakonia cowanii]WRY57876.1 hypothetical protein P8F81_14620 [Kosakonia cowanii]